MKIGQTNVLFFLCSYKINMKKVSADKMFTKNGRGDKLKLIYFKEKEVHKIIFEKVNELFENVF